MTKHRTTVFLETDMLNAIRKVAKDDERPMAYHYDKALRAYGPIKKLLAKPAKKEVGRIQLAEEIPQDINMDAWAEWMQSRKGKTTDLTKAKQWGLLRKYPKAEQQLIIDASINSGWQGLFPLKGQQKPAEDFVKQHTNDNWREGL